ncbi:MAG TPA: three-Cys-motif partner protein TcmP [Blastocatellia bacterium]|nr:three-Cys-motif partner protein TcmP [Blastocatellia bacterium]
MAPKSSLWKLEPHTRGKHHVLRRYLEAWFPIMGSWNGRILFIDGFAGPGEYEDGEEGSPIIALNSFLDHRSRAKVSAEVVFLFIEKDKNRAEHLEGLLKKLRSSLPSNCKASVVNEAFDQKLTQVLGQLDAQAKRLAPCFVMIDPFGVSDTPMDVIRRILRNPKSEVYVSFMYEFINRFKETPEFARHLDSLFGTTAWREGFEIGDQERKQFFYSLYDSQLRSAGAKYVLHFEMYEGQRLVYAIFFGTHGLKGCDRMKQAIWKVAPFGDFAFKGSRSGQLSLELKFSDFGPLKRALRQEFHDKGWVRIKEVSDFVASDHTDYHTNQFKANALVPMEEANEIEVDETSRKMKRRYPDGTKLRFLKPDRN